MAPKEIAEAAALDRALYPVKQGAHKLGISVSLAYRGQREGWLRMVRIAGKTLIPASEIARIASGADRDSRPHGGNPCTQKGKLAAAAATRPTADAAISRMSRRNRSKS